MLATALGVFVLYCKRGQGGLKGYVPDDLVRTWHLSDDRLLQIEAVLFLITGTAVAMLMTQPQTPQQAFAAGLGWTGLIAKPNRIGR